MMSEAAIAAKYGSRVGERFGLLTFVGVPDRRGDRNRLLGDFRCDCGTLATFQLSRALGGKYRSNCGCLTDRGKSRTHGMRSSPEYSSWQAMKARCLDPDNKDYPRWGGRGVTVYPEWIESFAAFYAHIGPRPAGMTLDRIDNAGGYEPGNVRWATPQTQQRNRRKSYVWHVKGQRFETCAEAARHFGVSEHTVWRWVRGQADPRRNTGTPKREDCNAVARY